MTTKQTNSRQTNGETNKAFSDEIIKDLELLNVENQLKVLINDYTCEYIKAQLQGKSDVILEEINKIIFNEFEKCMEQYTNNEKKHIQECLNSENVFNLTSKPISPELIKWLKKGPKYNPYVKKEATTYLRDFDLQFTESLKRIIRYYKGA